MIWLCKSCKSTNPNESNTCHYCGSPSVKEGDTMNLEDLQNLFQPKEEFQLSLETTLQLARIEGMLNKILEKLK